MLLVGAGMMLAPERVRQQPVAIATLFTEMVLTHAAPTEVTLLLTPGLQHQRQHAFDNARVPGYSTRMAASPGSFIPSILTLTLNRP